MTSSLATQGEFLDLFLNDVFIILQIDQLGLYKVQIKQMFTHATPLSGQISFQFITSVAE